MNCIEQKISLLLNEASFADWGIASSIQPTSIEPYKLWLQNDYQGDMQYLARHLPIKENPTMWLPDAKSAIVVIEPYFPFPLEKSYCHFHQLEVSLYALGQDYHFWLKQKLDSVATKLKEVFPEHEFKVACDAEPLLERDLAYQAGLGWIGKNTCLISRKFGSLFFIGEILTTLPLSSNKQISANHCGKCQNCIASCPTKALLEEKILDARKCLSYLTIECKSIPDETLQKQFDCHLFGCDICQTVCPWNHKILNEHQSLLSDLKPSINNSSFSLHAPAEMPKINLAILREELRFILSRTEKELANHFANTPLARSAKLKLHRTALIIASNFAVTGLEKEIINFRNHPILSKLTINQHPIV